MRRIIVGSMSHAQQYRPRLGERYAVLSIIDVGIDAPQFARHKGLVEQLVIAADDCTPYDPPFDGRRLSPLSEKQAERIAHFVDEIAERIDTLVVHCHAGLSRSPGAALAIAEAMAIAEVDMLNGRSVVPNPHVRETLRAALELQRRRK